MKNSGKCFESGGLLLLQRPRCCLFQLRRVHLAAGGAQVPSGIRAGPRREEGTTLVPHSFQRWLPFLLHCDQVVSLLTNTSKPAD